VFSRWPSSYSYGLLTVITLLCLLPFSGRAFHVDDTLFVYAAQQIGKHPLDPYGVSIIWDVTQSRLSEVTKNPPLAVYYGAGVGELFGWSERALHLGFLLTALGAVLATYRLARHFTGLPLVAAAVLLLSPGFLVSGSSIMCDTMMVALWVLALTFWLEGLDGNRAVYLVLSGLLIGACALTKYFGMSLIPLLLVYSRMRTRRLSPWIWFLLIPVAILCAYQVGTRQLYGHGLLSDLGDFAVSQRAREQVSILAKALVATSFVGGCALPALTLGPILWKRKYLLIGLALCALLGIALALGWIGLGGSAQAVRNSTALREHWLLTSVELGLFLAGGTSVLALAIWDFREKKTPESLLLLLWTLGTFLFAAFLNWTVNARSVLPLIPAAGLLAARRLEYEGITLKPMAWRVAGALAVSGLIALWVSQADEDLANAGRNAAHFVQQQTRGEGGTVWFQGHWGFQHYMEGIGARAVDFENSRVQPGDVMVIPENNIEVFPMPNEALASAQEFELRLNQPLTTVRWELGAGFYSSVWGPLPFGFGVVPAERYYLLRLGAKAALPEVHP